MKRYRISKHAWGYEIKKRIFFFFLVSVKQTNGGVRLFPTYQETCDYIVNEETDIETLYHYD